MKDPVMGLGEQMIDRALSYMTDLARTIGCDEDELRREYEAELAGLEGERDRLALVAPINSDAAERLMEKRRLVDGQIAELREKLA